MSPLSKCLRSSWRVHVCFSRRHSSLITDLMENMDKRSAWDRFYTESSSMTSSFKNFEWFFGFDSVRDFLMPLLQSSSHPDSPVQVLDMGCGTSALGPSIYRHSPVSVQVTCADISPVAVQLMQEKTRLEAVRPSNPSSRLQFVELDCTQLDRRYSPNSLDLIVDKGTTDALLRSKEGKGKAVLVLQQCFRALQGSGSLLQFSDEDPDARLLWLESAALHHDVGVQEVGQLRGVCYFCYQVTPRPLAKC
uniref:Citrate synthase-lysine N-methyltransferase CSKMT, mitochondrial n=1 Tax=Oryzias latipes TaxID=8090 RepID=A0A3P9KU49_ORYLA